MTIRGNGDMSKGKIEEPKICISCEENPAAIGCLCQECYNSIMNRNENIEVFKVGTTGPLPKEQTIKAIRLMRAGMTQTEVSKLFGITRQRAYQIWKRSVR